MSLSIGTFPLFGFFPGHRLREARLSDGQKVWNSAEDHDGDGPDADASHDLQAAFNQMQTLH